MQAATLASSAGPAPPTRHEKMAAAQSVCALNRPCSQVVHATAADVENT